MFDLCVVTVLAVVALYVLAILLRVSCHFCGVAIPALGRAYFTAAASVGLSAVAAYFIGAFVAELLRTGFSPSLQFVALLVLVGANGAISTAVYAPLLETHLAKAFKVWLMQAVVFMALGLLFGCCAGIISLIR